MKVSVVTVVYNAEATIGHCMRSVAAQDCGDWEHLIIDGGSSDSTLDIVRDHACARTRIVSEPDDGVYDAMNKGLALASGELIGFLNADDFFARDDSLSLIVGAAAAHPSADAVGGSVAMVKTGPPWRTQRLYRSAGFRPWMLRMGHMPPHPGFYTRRAVVSRVGGFDKSLGIAADFDWMVRFFHVHQAEMRAIPETLVCFRIGGLSTRGLASARVINREALAACRRWGLRSNSMVLLGKYLLKACQFVDRPVDFP